MLRTSVFSFLSIVLMPFYASAAEWRIGPGSEIFLGTDTAFSVSREGVHGLGIMCRDSAPMIWTQGYASVAGPNRQDSFQVSVDGRSFAVTGEHVPPDGLWTGRPSKPLIDALKAGSRATVQVPGRARATYVLRGSSRAIGSVLSSCANTAADKSANSATSDGAVSLTAQLIETACGGEFTLRDGAEFTGFLDGDDKPDIVLDWSGVTCKDQSRGRGAGFCGATHCTIEIVLTQTGGRKQTLGLNPQLINRGFGRHALQTTTQGTACGGSQKVCEVVWRWTGQSLEAIQ